MIPIHEEQIVRDILEFADTKVTLPSGHDAVVVETTSGFNDDFEGTIIYVPGVHFKELGFK